MGNRGGRSVEPTGPSPLEAISPKFTVRTKSGPQSMTVVVTYRRKVDRIFQLPMRAVLSMLAHRRVLDEADFWVPVYRSAPASRDTF